MSETPRYLPVGRFSTAERDKEQYLTRHCVNGTLRQRPNTQVVRCATCGTEIYKFGALWATTKHQDYCRQCARLL